MPCDSIRDYEYEKELRKERDRQRKEKERQLRIEKSRKIILDQSKKLGWALKPKTDKSWTASKPYSNDKMEIEILDTGTIRISQDKISPANHMSADHFHLGIQTALGGKVTITRKLGAPHKHGDHIHAH